MEQNKTLWPPLRPGRKPEGVWVPQMHMATYKLPYAYVQAVKDVATARGVTDSTVLWKASMNIDQELANELYAMCKAHIQHEKGETK